MRDEAIVEEGRGAPLGVVDELVDSDEAAGWQLLAQRTDRRDRENVGAPRAFERIDIGARVELPGQYAVSAAMAREEADLDMADPSAEDFIGRLAPRRVHRDPLLVFQRLDGVETRTADNADDPLVAHCNPRC